MVRGVARAQFEGAVYLQADVVCEEEVGRGAHAILGVVRHARVELGEQEARLRSG